MHPPMHALYHLPNLVSHPTPRPTSKPTQWRTWGSKPGANSHSGWLSAARFAPDFSGADFDQADMPPTPLPHPTLRFPHQDMHPPHHSHNMACNMVNAQGMNLSALVIFASFELHIHAILHSHMPMICGLLHAIHAHDHA